MASVVVRPVSRRERVVDSSAVWGARDLGRRHATIDLGGAAVSMALKSGEIWVFRHDGGGGISLEPSVYLESGRLKPRATKQIVLSGRAIEYATRIRWSLAKAQDTAIGIRDLARDELEFND